MLHGKAYNYLLVLKKNVYRSKWESATKSLVGSWEGSYIFVRYKDGKSA
jgi:hypothetical protein